MTKWHIFLSYSGFGTGFAKKEASAIVHRLKITKQTSIINNLNIYYYGKNYWY